MVILGPNIALDKAKAVTGLSLADDGLVTQLTGDPQMVLKALVNEYKSLSGELATKTLAVLLTKYPNITFQETP